MPTVRLTITGKVQGVYYRATARDRAEAIGITGWIKNTAKGEVEAVASGSREQLDTFISWCRQGPPAAKVTGVAVIDIKEEGFENFRVVKG